MTYCKDYCEEKGISTSRLNEAQRTLYYIAENMRLAESIAEEGYKHFQMAIKALEQEPCEDCVSRQAVMQTLYDYGCESKTQDAIAELPSVQPKQKTGHWIFKEFDEETGISNSKWCSACNYPMAQVYDDYCAHCGAIMVEPQESEEKE